VEAMRRARARCSESCLDGQTMQQKSTTVTFYYNHAIDLVQAPGVACNCLVCVPSHMIEV